MDFINGVLQSFLGNILFLIFTGILMFILWAHKIGIKQIIKEIFFTETEDLK